jgi:hypothetical protein
MENYHELALRIRAAARQTFEPDSPDPRWNEARDLEWAARTLLTELATFRERFKREQTKPVTYWDLISDRERADLELRPAGGPECKSCGQPFKTDADFWRHYVTTDLEYPRSTGQCWKRVAQEYAGTRPEWKVTCLERQCGGAAVDHRYGDGICDFTIKDGEVSPKED